MPFPQKLHATLNRIQVQEWAEITPSAVAIVDEARILTYSDVMAESRLLALWLAACGAKPRTTVASLMEHCAEYILAQLAASQTGTQWHITHRASSIKQQQSSHGTMNHPPSQSPH